MPQLVMILQILALYVMQVLSLGLIWHNFLDATKEGDGNRIIQCWKFLLLAFKATNRKSYCVEALNLLLQVNYLLSSREAAQVKWCHTVNTTNLQGHNVSMDLHLEHLNRRLKSAIRKMSSNVTYNSVKLAAESVDLLIMFATFLRQQATQRSKILINIPALCLIKI